VGSDGKDNQLKVAKKGTSPSYTGAGTKPEGGCLGQKGGLAEFPRGGGCWGGGPWGEKGLDEHAWGRCGTGGGGRGFPSVKNQLRRGKTGGGEVH